MVGVIDILDGVAVRAIGGTRHRYRPWVSPLAGSSDPLAIARAVRDQYQLTTLYTADLNALRGQPGSRNVVRSLVADGFRVTLDAGIRSAGEIDGVLELGVETVVLPLETLPHCSCLLEWSREFDSRRLVFGLDLADGVPMASSRTWDMPVWRSDSPVRIAGDVFAMGISHFIVLDVRRVGLQEGSATATLCQKLRKSLPEATIWTGGGVRDAEDIERLRAAGADRVMVATALHEGTL